MNDIILIINYYQMEDGLVVDMDNMDVVQVDADGIIKMYMQAHLHFRQQHRFKYKPILHLTKMHVKLFF